MATTINTASATTTAATASIFGDVKLPCTRDPTQSARRGNPVHTLIDTSTVAISSPIFRVCAHGDVLTSITVLEYRERMKKRMTRSEQRENTRAALRDAAWTVFLRRGYAGSSVEEIAAEAGYTRGAFYYNFDSLGELFVDLLQARVYSLYREMENAGSRRTSPPIRFERPARSSPRCRRPPSRRHFRLWLELLAEAGRDEGLKQLAAGFWTGNRELLAELIRRDYDARGCRRRSMPVGWPPP